MAAVTVAKRPPPAGFDRVVRAAGRLEPSLRRAWLADLLDLSDVLSVDEMVRAVESGRVPEVVAEAVEVRVAAAASASMLATMSGQLSRLQAGIVFDLLAPSLPGREGPAEGAWPTRGTAGPFEVDFAAVDQAAAEWARQQWIQDWAGISDQAQQTVRDILSRAPVEGISVDRQARMLRDVIGLDSRQAAGYANRLTDLNRRLPSMPGPQRVREEARLERWRQAQLRVRAERIARTETAWAQRASQTTAWQQAVDAGLLDPSRDQQEWSASPGACADCEELDGQLFPLLEVPPEIHPLCRCSMILHQG